MASKEDEYVCTCTDCGKEVSAQDRRCPHCGGDLGETVLDSALVADGDKEVPCCRCQKAIRGEEFAFTVLNEVRPPKLDALLQGVQCDRCLAYVCLACGGERMRSAGRNGFAGAKCPRCGSAFHPRGAMLSGDIEEKVGASLRRQQGFFNRGKIYLPVDGQGLWLGLVLVGFGLYALNSPDFFSSGLASSTRDSLQIYFYLLTGMGGLQLAAAVLPRVLGTPGAILLQVANLLALSGFAVFFQMQDKKSWWFLAAVYFLFCAGANVSKFLRLRASLRSWRRQGT